MENFFGPYPNCSSSSPSAPNTSNQETSMGILGSLISPAARFQSRPSSVMTSATDQKSKQEKDFTVGSGSSSSNGSHEIDTMKRKIIFHPQFPNLLHSYIECQKVGAPPEVAARLAATWREFESRQRSPIAPPSSKDAELDQFMEAYSDMLIKYREEITRPVQEAMEFMRNIESQLNIITNGRIRLQYPNEVVVGRGDEGRIDPRAEDGELKRHLLRKYSGYLTSLKQELSKKKKVRKLPKEARQRLLTWWELHYKWPYPSESEKAELAETTGLDQKQINNWFINQRKRHWKPSEEMQFMGELMMEHHQQQQSSTTTYMEQSHFMNEASTYRFPT
ncbi:hypothetical protein V2J09_011828 [Rumex salicifolius]